MPVEEPVPARPEPEVKEYAVVPALPTAKNPVEVKLLAKDTPPLPEPYNIAPVFENVMGDKF